MYQFQELTLEEYEKALKKTKREALISIAMHHIKLVREWKKKYNIIDEINYIIPNEQQYQPFDYQTICKKNSSIKFRRKLDIGDIWANQAKCLKCFNIIRSKNRHDFVTCPCGNLSVDGGSWYLKRSAKNVKDFKELSENFKYIEKEQK